jgi:hypothetical protein
MFSLVLRHGTTVDLLGRAGDGSSWALRYYPQGFHVLAAGYAELAGPGTTSGAPALTLYAQAIAALVVLGTMVVVAAVCSLPGLTRRPLVAAPTVAVVVTAVLWEPGGRALADGFPNFWLGAVTAAVALLLAVAPPRGTSLVSWAAIAAGFVLVAHTWAPLLVLAGPAVLVALPPRDRWPQLRRRSVLLVGSVACLAGLGMLKAGAMLVRIVDVSVVVDAGGGVTIPPLTLTLLWLVAPIGVLFGVRPWMRRHGTVEDGSALSRAVPRLAVAGIGAVGSLAVLAAAQLREIHTLSYYFFKYLLGAELVLAVVAAAVAGAALGLAPRVTGRRVGLALSALVCMVATQSFGPVGWQEAFARPTVPPRTALPTGSMSLEALSRDVLAVAESTPESAALRRDYLVIGVVPRFGAVLPDSWFHALDGGITERQSQRLTVLVPVFPDVGHAAPAALQLLQRDPRASVVVARRYVEPLRRTLGDRYADRITG